MPDGPGTFWNDAPLVALDLEGTGAQDREHEAILEIATVPIVQEQPSLPAAYTTLINPERPVPRRPWISPGLTDDLLAQAPTLEEVAPTLTPRLDGRVIVGHNIGVDWRLQALSQRPAQGPDRHAPPRPPRPPRRETQRPHRPPGPSPSHRSRHRARPRRPAAPSPLGHHRRRLTALHPCPPVGRRRHPHLRRPKAHRRVPPRRQTPGPDRQRRPGADLAPGPLSLPVRCPAPRRANMRDYISQIHGLYFIGGQPRPEITVQCTWC